MSLSPEPSRDVVQANTNRGAGRGVILLAGSNVFFIFAGMAIQFGLPAVLSRSTFGAYTLVNSIASLFNNVIVTATIQAVSRQSAQDPEKARPVQQAGFRMHLRIGLAVSIAFVAASPLVAWLLHDMTKTAPLALAGVIIAGYSFYAVFVGTANGLHRFGVQSGLTVVFAAIRAAALIGAGVAGASVVGVVGGWVGAVVIILVITVVWVGMPGKIPAALKQPVTPMLKFFASVSIYLVFFNALMFVDNLLVKRLMSEYFERTAGPGADIAALADVQVGYYGAVQNLARLSYQILIAATFVAFPLVSRSTFVDDKEATKRYVEVITRYSLIAGCAIAVVMAANPAGLLGLVYAKDFVENGAAALPFLAIGNVAFSLIAIAGTILNGAGQTRTASMIAAGSLFAAFVGNYIAIPIAAGGGHVLTVAAAVTGGMMVLGAVASGIVLRKQFGGFLPVISVVRVGIALAVAIAVGHVLPFHGKVMTLAGAIIVATVFLVALFALREIDGKDLERIKAIRRKKA